MAEEHRYYSVFDLLGQMAKEGIQAKLDEQIRSNPSFSGVTGATNARLKPGNTWRITAVQSWLPDPVETPLRVNKELMASARPRFTPYGMMYKPYAEDAVTYEIGSAPAPMSAEMEIQLEAIIEAYDRTTISDEGKVRVHTVRKLLLLPAHLDMAAVSLKLGDLAPFSEFSTASGRIFLNEYLLPANWDAAACDLLAMRIVREYMPECLYYKLPLDAYELVRRMGLHLHWKLLSYDFGILGEIFDRGCKTSVIEIHTREENKNFVADAGTILLDDRLKSGNHYPMEVIYTTLAHECVHWYKDRMYIALQNVFDPQVHLSVCRNSPAAHRSGLFEQETASDLNLSLPSDLMEAQALAIPPHILINARSGREKVADIVRAYGGEITEDNYFEIIDELRSFFSVTKYAADKRLREFGYRIPRLSGSSRRFNYQHRAGSGIVYDISFDRLLELDDEEKYPDFARRLSTGKYVYVDYRLCLNTRDYVEYDSAGMPHLTILARSNPAACCIPFKAVSVKDPDLGSGAMAASRPKAEPVVRVPEEPSPNLQDDMAAFAADLKKINNYEAMTVGQEMNYHRTHPVEITYENWSHKSFVSERKLKQFCKDPIRPKPEFRTFLRAVFGLQIDGELSIPLIKKAKLTPPDDAEHVKVIKLALKTFYNHPIIEIHQLLYQYNYQLIETSELKKEGLNLQGRLVES